MWEAGDAGERMLERLCDCVRAGATYGVPVIVVHLSSGMTPPRMNDIGFERYDRLMRLAEREGVTIAYENIRRLDNVVYMLENYPKAGFCWDVGHEACYMNGAEFMPLFGKRMAALHLHDNTAVYGEDILSLNTVEELTNRTVSRLNSTTVYNCLCICALAVCKVVDRICHIGTAEVLDCPGFNCPNRCWWLP